MKLINLSRYSLHLTAFIGFLFGSLIFFGNNYFGHHRETMYLIGLIIILCSIIIELTSNYLKTKRRIIWYAAIIVSTLLLATPFLPLAILSLIGLLHKSTRKSIKKIRAKKKK